MLLDPGASAAVEKLAVPLLSFAVSRMLPLLWSVNVTDPAGVPVTALTLAVNFTHESRVTDTADDVSVVVVEANPRDAAATSAVAAAGALRLTAAATLKPIKERLAQRMVTHLPGHGGTAATVIIAANPADQGRYGDIVHASSLTHRRKTSPVLGIAGPFARSVK
jgi:hypothetical protein